MNKHIKNLYIMMLRAGSSEYGIKSELCCAYRTEEYKRTGKDGWLDCYIKTKKCKYGIYIDPDTVWPSTDRIGKIYKIPKQ